MRRRARATSNVDGSSIGDGLKRPLLIVVLLAAAVLGGAALFDRRAIEATVSRSKRAMSTLAYLIGFGLVAMVIHEFFHLAVLPPLR